MLQLFRQVNVKGNTFIYVMFKLTPWKLLYFDLIHTSNVMCKPLDKLHSTMIYHVFTVQYNFKQRGYMSYTDRNALVYVSESIAKGQIYNIYLHSNTLYYNLVMTDVIILKLK